MQNDIMFLIFSLQMKRK